MCPGNESRLDRLTEVQHIANRLSKVFQICRSVRLAVSLAFADKKDFQATKCEASPCFALGIPSII
eukprot:scaffold60150_cov21-Prasinocladus_malaysianus.AAC.1